MSDFSVLPVSSGEGPYQFNRYRVLFQREPGRTKQFYAQSLVNQFPDDFNSEFAEVVRVRERNHDGAPVLKFHGFAKIMKSSFDLAAYHHDWVAQVALNPEVGFAVQTVSRNFREWEDAKMGAEAGVGGAIGGGVAGLAGGAAVGALLGGIGAGPGAVLGGELGAAGGAVVGVVSAYNANFLHFLAGRRSWLINDASAFGLQGDYCVLETAALERFSCEFYRLNDKAQGLLDKVPAIWNAMLTNFIRRRGLTVPKQLPPVTPWKMGGPDLSTRYFTITFDALDQVKSFGEFQQALRLHPDLLPPPAT